MQKQNGFFRRLFIGGFAVFAAGFVGGWFWEGVSFLMNYLSFVSPFHGN